MLLEMQFFNFIHFSDKLLNILLTYYEDVVLQEAMIKTSRFIAFCSNKKSHKWRKIPNWDKRVCANNTQSNDSWSNDAFVDSIFFISGLYLQYERAGGSLKAG